MEILDADGGGSLKSSSGTLAARDKVQFMPMREVDGDWFYDLVSHDNGILKKGMEIFLTGCYLRIFTDGAVYPRFLPTEYLVVLLDEIWIAISNQ
ncbi:protein BONZAI 1-like isoform X2 [Silene latifolia]|uniref:protein BONZAI 1-like isoform X2 n=1 Tax=Silene latifolia TaxID=37657 RepID=UPI003D779626